MKGSLVKMMFQITYGESNKVLFPCVFVALTIYQGVSTCQDLVLLGTEFNITGYTLGLNYTLAEWERPYDGIQVAECNPDNVAPRTTTQSSNQSECTFDNGYAAMVKTDEFILTIYNVSLNDVGTWVLTVYNFTHVFSMNVCNLTCAKLPECSISADLDTNALMVGDSLTFTVVITGYYCTREHSFNLTTGNVSEMLYGSPSETNLTDLVVNTAIHVTNFHFGLVSLNFFCEYTVWDLNCGGIHQLEKKSDPKDKDEEVYKIPVILIAIAGAGVGLSASVCLVATGFITLRRRQRQRQDPNHNQQQRNKADDKTEKGDSICNDNPDDPPLKPV